MTGRKYLIDLCHRMQRFILDAAAAKTAASSRAFRRKAASMLAYIACDIADIRFSYVTETMSLRLNIPLESAGSLARRTYRSFFENAMEMASIMYLSGDEIRKCLEPRGLDNLRAALSRGCGAIIVSAHYGLWEFVPPWLDLNGFPITVVVRRQNNKLIDEWFERMRTLHGPIMTDSGFGMREILRSLARGRSLGLMSDQNAGKQGIFIDFFNALASTVPGPAMISLRTGAPIVPVAAHRNNGTGPHIMEIAEPIYPESYADFDNPALRMTQDYSRIIERWIRKRPDQWFWLHRRWKTRPEDLNLKPDETGSR